MVKNQHLLGGLVVLGGINALAFLGVISGERGSAQAIKGLEGDLAAARAEQKQSAELLGRDNREMRRELEEATAVIGQLKDDVANLRERLSKTRKALEALEERVDKQAPRPADTKEGGQ
jgi:chromosome segregation ATPase